MGYPKHVEELLNNLADSLQIPSTRYEAAERSYKSVGEWLQRKNSTLRDADPQVYIQGSFRLGTVIKPVSDEEDYDVDLVCELSLLKTQLSQAQLKSALGYELKLYAEARQMANPEEGKRCWTQNYTDGSQFHMDTLPAIPDAVQMRLLLEHQAHPTKWADTAIAITDLNHPLYQQITNAWPQSNPKGYSDWFRSRMVVVFDKQRLKLALESQASVEEIPEYKVRTPLQSAIQILKHHRDKMFIDRSDEKPISIIVTTLAGHAYNQEPSIAGALFSILQHMDDHIENRDGVDWIANPTNPTENFSDRWQNDPVRKAAFYEWLEKVRSDFARAALTTSREAAGSLLHPSFGKHLRINSPVVVLNPEHKEIPPWNLGARGYVRITHGTIKSNYTPPKTFADNAEKLPKHSRLRFFAESTVPEPYEVYWQVINTGNEASTANDLRGGFFAGRRQTEKLTRDESSLYAGTHSIECFIIKNELIAARSGQFIVNIQ